MQNSTNTTEGSPETLSTSQIVTIVLSCCSLLGTLLTITYIKIKSQFRDRQDSKIKLTNKITEDGTISNEIVILYRNDENYSEKSISMKNGKNKNDDSKLFEFPNDSQIDRVLSNNNLGDAIIADTRKGLEQKALDTYIKTVTMTQSSKKITDTTTIDCLGDSINSNSTDLYDQII